MTTAHPEPEHKVRLGRKYGVECIRNQWYLNPHPLELKLRNHA